MGRIKRIKVCYVEVVTPLRGASTDAVIARSL